MAETRLIQGRYRLLDQIGRGGMGEVWRARDESLGRRVAVKCLKPLVAARDQSLGRVVRERFRREARVAASLQHRGVTVVHDFGEDDGILFLVMELLEGRNLSQLLEDNDRGPLPLPDVVDIADQVSAALAYTHQQGIVHRDLKPANIMRLTDGTVKICDFGIARLGHDIGFTARLTGLDVTMGTPHYMSPEQIEGVGSVDNRSDLYSLGCVLYELVTGAPPFNLDDTWAVLVGHRHTPPESPRRDRPEIPEVFESIILDLLAKDPDDRPADAAELIPRLEEARIELTGRATPPHAWSVPAQTPAWPIAPAPPARGADAGLAGLGPSSSVRPATRPSEARLPDWARNMTTGTKAGAAAWAAQTTPAEGVAGYVGMWTPGAAPGEPAQPPSRPQQPIPPREQVDRLAARHSAGLSLGHLGRWEEAREQLRGVAAERAALLGADHPDTLTSRYEVAFTLGRLGRPADALREYEQVAQGRERVLGPDHPETLAARQETAFALGLLGRHAEAHQVYTAVLAARERTMGSDHPATLRCRHNFAFCLSRLGRLDEAYTTAREVADARARVLGPDHAETLATRYEVASIQGLLGRWSDALSTYQEVADARTRTLGPDHPDTLATRYEAGISLGRLGRSEDALLLFRDLVDARTRAHGPNAPQTLSTRHVLGVNLGRLGRWEEALDEARDVCAIRERTLGPDHPDTQISRREVAVALGWLGRWPDALAAYRQISQAHERALGAGHPATLACLSDEAHCLEHLGRSAEAAEVHQRIAALRRPPNASGG